MTKPFAVSEQVPVDLEGDAGARMLLAWWHREQARTQAMPRRQALDVTEFLALLGAITLIDIEADGRLRLRLYGERMASVDPQDAPFGFIDDLTPRGYRDRALADYHAMIALAQPCGFRVHLRGVKEEDFVYYRLMLPLADQDGQFRHILVFNPMALNRASQLAIKRLLDRWRNKEQRSISPE
jgi:hypothetical protein